MPQTSRCLVKLCNPDLNPSETGEAGKAEKVSVYVYHPHHVMLKAQSHFSYTPSNSTSPLPLATEWQGVAVEMFPYEMRYHHHGLIHHNELISDKQ